MLLPSAIIISEYYIIFQKVDEPQLTCGDCFQFYAIINNAVMNKFMHKAFSVFQIISLGYSYRIGIIGSKYVIILRLDIYCQTAFQKPYLFTVYDSNN